MLKLHQTDLKEVLVLEYTVNKDSRAVSHRTYSCELMYNSGILTEFTEEISYHPMKQNILYGIHFQNYPKPQTKLIYCAKGRILDFAIDLRHNSSTFKKWISVELSSLNIRTPEIILSKQDTYAPFLVDSDCNL